MSRTTNKLSATKVKALKFEGKNKKVFDGGGLYIHVQKSGKYWRLKYRYCQKEKTLALGVYPLVSLAEARELRTKYKKTIAEGLDPIVVKKAKIKQFDLNARNTFKAVALEWHREVCSHNVSKNHAKTCLDRLNKYIFPKIGDIPIGQISAPELLTVLRELEKKGILETVKRVRSICSQVFRYAIITSKATRDPAADLKGALKTPKENHHPAITNPDEISKLLSAIDSYNGHATACNALKIAPLLFVRPGELRQAKWKDFDLEKGIWSYQPNKGGLPFDFPLSWQAIEILKEQKHVSHNSEYVFPSTRNNFRPMSNNTMNAALCTLGFKGRMTPHGFRAMARTVLAERLNFKAEYIEQQLAHNVRDSLGRAYNRTTFFEQRKKMMQAWADYLDGLRLKKSDNLIYMKNLRA